MYIAVTPVIKKILMSGKIVLSGMFNNQDAIGFQYVAFEHQCRYLSGMRHVKRRIGKNNIILYFANRQKMKNIVAYNANLAEPKFSGSGADKGSMAQVYFHSMNIAASTRSKFVTDAAGACKQVKRFK